MKQRIECVVVGGPQHGLIIDQLLDSEHPAPLALVTDDGEQCVAAALGPAGSAGKRVILMHPWATGRQLMGVLATLHRQIGSVCAPLAA